MLQSVHPYKLSLGPTGSVVYRWVIGRSLLGTINSSMTACRGHYEYTQRRGDHCAQIRTNLLHIGPMWCCFHMTPGPTGHMAILDVGHERRKTETENCAEKVFSHTE